MAEFTFTFVADEGPPIAIEGKFADQTILFPDWVLEAIHYFDLDESELAEFHKGIRKLNYAEFLEATREEAVLVEQREQKESLNRLQQNFLAAFFARRKMFKNLRTLRALQ